MVVKMSRKARHMGLSKEQKVSEELSDLDVFITLLHKNGLNKLDVIIDESGKTKSKIRSDLQLKNF